MRTGVAVPLLGLAVLGIPRHAYARERLAVLISVEGEQELADNLSEVVIAELSTSSRELVGQRELSDRLLWLDAYARGGVRACVEEPGCLAGVGAAANAKLVVVGAISKHERRFSIELSVVDTQTGARREVGLETATNDTAELIAAVQDGAERLFATVPPDAARLEAKSAAEIIVGDRQLETQRDVPATMFVAYAAAGAALLTFSAAIATNALGRAAPRGAGEKLEVDGEPFIHVGVARKRLMMAACAFGVIAGVAYLWR
jgi:hypothetical protein